MSTAVAKIAYFGFAVGSKFFRDSNMFMQTPDAALIAQAKDLIGLHKKELQIRTAFSADEHTIDMDPMMHNGLFNDVRDASRVLAEMPATSIVGLAAKAQTMLALINQDQFALSDTLYEYKELVASILWDAATLDQGCA